MCGVRGKVRVKICESCGLVFTPAGVYNEGHF